MSAMLKITCDHYFLKKQCQLTMKAKKQKMNMKKSHSPIIYLYFLPPPSFGSPSDF